MLCKQPALLLLMSGDSEDKFLQTTKDPGYLCSPDLHITVHLIIIRDDTIATDWNAICKTRLCIFLIPLVLGKLARIGL